MQWDLSIIQAWMLWPHDEAARERAIVAVTGEFGRKTLPFLTEEMKDCLILLGSGTWPEINKLAKKPFLNGGLAGKILHRVVARILSNSENGSIGDAKKEISQIFPPSKHLGIKTIETIWTNYRRVSHFWAAYVDRITTTNDYAFPCRMDRLADLGVGAAASTIFRLRFNGACGKTRHGARRPIVTQGSRAVLSAKLLNFCSHQERT
jgi:hypothetical protein